MDTFGQTLRNLGPMRIAVMGGVIIGLVAFFIYLTSRLATPQLSLLYSNMDPEDSTRIASQLKSSGVPHEIRGNGSQVYVPADKVASLRLTMANQGMPRGGSIGYEIFDNSDNFGATAFTQNINLVRALEGEIARSISTIGSVGSARVHLVLPRRAVFSRVRQEPSASIVLKMRGAGRLAASQVAAIQHLVAAAIPGLQPDRISIVDNKGTLLARGTGGDSGSAMANGAEEKRVGLQNRLSRNIEEMLEMTVGPGKVRAEVSAEIDFDRISISEETFNPDGQVVRSTQSVEESTSSSEADISAAVTVGGGLPDANQGTDNANSSASETRTEETVNFEISKKVINHVREPGLLKRLSVAVLVDGNYIEGADGVRTYKPRDIKEMELLATLVRGVIGFDADRGDSVEVINMQFVEVEEGSAPQIDFLFGLEKEDLLRMAEILVLSIVAILVLLLVVRPLVTRAFEAIPSAASAASEAAARISDQTATAVLAGPNMGMDNASGNEFEDMIDLERIEGRVKASSVKKVGEIVHKHPEEALSIIRSWLYQES